jgi:hypothetical protein
VWEAQGLWRGRQKSQWLLRLVRIVYATSCLPRLVTVMRNRRRSGTLYTPLLRSGMSLASRSKRPLPRVTRSPAPARPRRQRGPAPRARGSLDSPARVAGGGAPRAQPPHKPGHAVAGVPAQTLQRRHGPPPLVSVPSRSLISKQSCSTVTVNITQPFPFPPGDEWDCPMPFLGRPIVAET